MIELDWMQKVELRRRVQIGLNKGQAKNALAHINLTVAAPACRSTKAIAQRSQHGVWNSSIFMTCAVCRHRPVPRRPGSGGHFQAPFTLMTLGTLQVQ
ncbi:MAG: hypothetical protein V5B40_00940 [Candidatus Accumulibacter meliphilus]|uniref:hypothetical protein n=1 Tax=Candidatus Accumulibacter meliphilus TaxID=2211374 RepID=UPI002FC3920B